MHVSRLIIKNFRSIKYLDIKFNRGKNVIVGRNNAGKSNIVKALDIVLGEKSPTYENYENISETDFYCTKTTEENFTTYNYENALYIFCELTREPNEALDFNEINKAQGFFKLIGNKVSPGDPTLDTDEKINRMEERDGGFEIFAENIFAYDIDSPTFNKWRKTRWVDSKINNQIRFEHELTDKYSFGLIFKAERDEERIKKSLRLIYRENRESNWILTFKSSLRNQLLQSAIMSSFRDPASQLRLNQWSWYGKLIKALISNTTELVDLNAAFASVKTVADRIFADAKNQIHNSSLNIAFPSAELYFQFNQDVKTDIYKNCAIYIDDGVKSLLTDKGSGIQSATIIGLFAYYVNEVNTHSSALLCVEEPELYLHPHARRVISDRLDEFAGERNQVILTTHSSEFISSTSSDLNIVLINRSEDRGSIGKNLNLRQRKSILLDNRYNEIFFADAVILCEGNDSYILEWTAKYHFGDLINEKNISIIPVGGKDRLPFLLNTIKRIGLKVYIFADFDFILRDEGEEVNNYPGISKHKSIIDLGESYFRLDYIYSTNGAVKFRQINDLRENIKENQERDFYKAKSASDCTQDLQLLEITNDLRNAGIGILNCDIEELINDRFLLNRESKFDMDSAFKLSGKLVNGEDLGNLINTSQIKQFLTKVLT